MSLENETTFDKFIRRHWGDEFAVQVYMEYAKAEIEGQRYAFAKFNKIAVNNKINKFKKKRGHK